MTARVTAPATTSVAAFTTASATIPVTTPVMRLTTVGNPWTVCCRQSTKNFNAALET
ncbi:hypothetical protein SAMN05444920_101464 [Nonomuraea solani]|uniref:Uncharacterized protein n=1 Tax=Nonomuraea solani TaxID=1144553 RepID=A0A1H5UAD6_9ACTN|nr:hypothetical protein SAMN05444920_101464 [Nonomuraea solani]